MTMNAMEQEAPKTADPAPTPLEIIEAAKALARVCDGAVSDDERGYNGADSPTVKSILKFQNPTVRQIRALWNILRKYRKQLAGYGFNYDLLVPPPLPPAPDGKPGARVDASGKPVPVQLVVQLTWVGTQYGRRIAVSSPYSPEVVAAVRKLPKRWFDKEGKNSVRIRNAWIIPDDVDELDTLVGHLEEIEPAVRIELAEDLRVHMSKAREERRAAYAESRAEDAQLEIPTKLPLRPFQRAGVKWALDHDGRVVVGDDMGLGKTCQALGFLAYKGKEALPALVFCSSTLRGNWAREVGKFTDFNYQILTAKSSLKQLRKAGFVANVEPGIGYDVTILNYDILEAETAQTWIKTIVKGGTEEELQYAHENLVLSGHPAMKLIVKAMMNPKHGLDAKNRLNRVKDEIYALKDAARKKGKHVRSSVNGIPVEEFLKMGWKTLVCDELQYIKDSSSQRGMAIDALSRGVKYALGLTGTPIMNRPKEAWHQVHCVAPKVFPSFFDYARRYCNGHETRFGWNFSGASNLEELDRKLRTTVMIRRMKEQVLTELPPKIRITVPMLLEDKEYEDETKDPKKKLELLKKEREEWKAVLAPLSAQERQRFIAEHAEQAARVQKLTGFILDGIEECKQAAVRAKFDACVKFILDLEEAQGKVIVFMNHHEFIDRMVAEMEKAGLKTGMIDGRVPPGKRDAIKDAFQEGDTQILVAGIRAASEGLTLTASHTVVFVELDWNPSRHYQAEDRVYRIGQTVQPTMYYLVGLGTIEEEIARMIDSKREVVNASLGEGDRTVKEDGILDAVLDELLK
jgi:SNF2 family DNA or RNA helicase